MFCLVLEGLYYLMDVLARLSIVSNRFLETFENALSPAFEDCANQPLCIGLANRTRHMTG